LEVERMFGQKLAPTVRQEVLCVSKPVGPPWHDSGKNLVRDIAATMVDFTPRLLMSKGQGFRP